MKRRKESCQEEEENALPKINRLKAETLTSWPKLTFYQRTNGLEGQLQSFKSFHTHRILKPYIRQDFETEPLKLKLLHEIQEKFPASSESRQQRRRYPINYTYLQPKYVSQINRLACQFFWPGIDGNFHLFL